MKKMYVHELIAVHWILKNDLSLLDFFSPKFINIMMLTIFYAEVINTSRVLIK